MGDEGRSEVEDRFPRCGSDQPLTRHRAMVGSHQEDHHDRTDCTLEACLRGGP